MQIEIIDHHFQHHIDTIASFLIRTADGYALVESGPYSTFDHLSAGLAEKGISVGDIRHVFLTHIHFDHAGASWKLAELGATIYVHPFGAKHLADPAKLVNSARLIYKDQMDSLWGAIHAVPSEKIRAVEHGEVISLGDCEFQAWYTPGHAVHHIAWQAGEALFTGDMGGIRIEHGIILPPCPPPDINIEHWQDSINLVKSLDVKYLFLTHYGKYPNTPQHWLELEQILWEWANWMKPRWERQEDTEAVIVEFQAYVDATLNSKGISGEQLDRYNSANPAYMSVAGLMRYWSKKQEIRTQLV